MDWFYQQQDTAVGPVSLEEIKQLAAQGTVSRETLVWNDEQNQRLRAADVPQIAMAFGSERGVLEASSRSIKLHAELKKLQWSDLPKAKLTLAQKAIKSQAVPAAATDQVSKIQAVNAEIKLAQQPAAAAAPEAGSAKLLNSARDLAQGAVNTVKVKTLQRQLRGELEKLADVILASDMDPPPAIATELAACRELVQRVAKLTAEAGPLIDMQAAAKSWSDVKGDLGSAGQWAQRNLKRQQLERVALPRADHALAAALLAAQWPASVDDPTIAILAQQIAAVEQEQAQLATPAPTAEHSAKGMGAALKRFAGQGMQAIQAQKLQRRHAAFLARLGAAARTSSALAKSAANEQAAWTEPLREAQKIVAQIEQLREDNRHAPPLRISWPYYLASASATVACLLLVGLCGWWLFGGPGDASGNNLAKGPLAVDPIVVDPLAGGTPAPPPNESPIVPPDPIILDQTKRPLPAPPMPAPQPAPHGRRDDPKPAAGGGNEAHQPIVVAAAARPVPIPPRGLPLALAPLAPPDLKALIAALPKTEVGPPLSPRPAVNNLFPTKLSGLFHAQLGGSTGKGFVWLEVDLENISRESPDWQKPRVGRFANAAATRQQMDEQGGMILAKYLIDQFPHSFGGNARQVQGTIRVFRIGDPQLNPRDKGYLAERKKEVDSTTCTGWVDEQQQLLSIKAARWASGKDPLIYNALRDLKLSGYWLPETKIVSGWGETEWQLFSLAADEAAADSLLNVGIASNQAASAAERKALNDFRQPYESSPQKEEDVGRANQLLQPLMVPEHADMFNKMRVGDIYFRCINLFSSHHFAECFGKPFKKLDYLERYRVERALDAVAKAYPKKDPKLGYDYFAGALRAMPDLFSDSDYSTSLAFVANQRAKQQWLADLLKKNEQPATYEGAFIDWERTEPWRGVAQLGVLPTAMAESTAALAQIRRDRATATLDAWNRPLETDIEKEQFADLLAVVGPQQAEKYERKAAAAAQSNLLSQLVQDFAQFVALKDDVKALRPVGEWLNRLRSEYVTLERSEAASVYEAVRKFGNQRHQRLLEVYLPQVVFELDTADKEEFVNAAREWATAREDFLASDAGKQVAAAIERNLARLQREYKLRFFSAQEREWIVGDSLTLTLPELVPEPTADSIRVAFYREMSKLPGSRWADPEQVQYSVPPLDRFDMFYTLKISRIDKLVIPQANHPQKEAGRTSLAEGDGYRCFFRISPQIQTPDMTKFGVRPDDIQAKFLSGMMKLAEAEARITTASDVFVLTNEGWRSPTIRARGHEGLAKVYTSWAEGLSAVSKGMANWPVAQGRLLRVRVGNRSFEKWVYP